jgi:hypothetical protein
VARASGIRAALKNLAGTMVAIKETSSAFYANILHKNFSRIKLFIGRNLFPVEENAFPHKICA